jgi:RNA polymerase sigma-70 factor (ECF subfamily)
MAEPGTRAILAKDSRRVERARIAELVRQAVKGSEEAFAALVHEFVPRLWHYLLAGGTPAQDIDDVVQEAFLRAHRAIATYDERYCFSTWLFTIARREAVNLRRKQRPAVALSEQPEPCAPEAPSRMEAREIWAVARRALDKRQYEAIWLRYAEDLTPREIATVMGISAVHVRVLLHRARCRLARCLEQER